MAFEENFTKAELLQFRSELRKARDQESDNEKLDYYRTTLLNFMGAILTPTKTVVIACLSVLPNYMSSLHDKIDDSIDIVTEYYEFLAEHETLYNMVKLKINTTTRVYNDKTIRVPNELELVGVHCLNPIGWDMA